MASNVYTIFGRYFGYTEKLNMSMSRLKETHERFVVTSLNVKKRYEQLSGATKTQEKLVKELDKGIVKHTLTINRLQNKQAAGLVLNTKEHQALLKSQTEVDSLGRQYSNANSRLESFTNQLHDHVQWMEISKLEGNKANEAVSNLIHNQEKLENQLLKTQTQIDQFTSAQDKNTAMGQVMSDTFGIGIFNSIAKLQNQMLNFSKMKVMIEEMGGVTGAMRAQWNSFKDTIAVVRTSYVGSMGTMRAATMAFATTLLPLVAIGLVLYGIFKGLQYIFGTIWKENIGGIQSKFVALIGTVKNMFAKMDVAFRKILREWGPALEPFFSMLFDISTIVVKIAGFFVGQWFKGLVKILTPTIKFLGYIGTIYKMIKLLFEWIAYGGDILYKSFVEPIMKVLGPVMKLYDIWQKMTGGDKGISDVGGFKNFNERLDALSPNAVKKNYTGGAANQNSFTNSPNVVIHGVDTNNQNAVARSSIQANQAWTQGMLQQGVNVPN